MTQAKSKKKITANCVWNGTKHTHTRTHKRSKVNKVTFFLVFDYLVEHFTFGNRRRRRIVYFVREEEEEKSVKRKIRRRNQTSAAATTLMRTYEKLSKPSATTKKTKSKRTQNIHQFVYSVGNSVCVRVY